jgi:5'(3')-deoxyribonucleotidase
MSRPHIAWDVDDVLADCQTAWVLWSQRTGIGNLRAEDFKTYDLSETFRCTRDEARRRLNLFLEAPECLEMIPFGEARQVLEQLTDFRHSAVTGRPHNIREATTNWIHRHYPGVFQEVYTTDVNPLVVTQHSAKAKVCQNIGAAYLVDDAPMHIPSCLEAGITVIMPAKPWNACFDIQHPYLHRVSSILEIPNLLNHLIKARATW